MEQSKTWKKYSKREFPIRDGDLPKTRFPERKPEDTIYRIVTYEGICTATPLHDSIEDPLGPFWKTRTGLISDMYIFAWQEQDRRQPLLPNFPE